MHGRARACVGTVASCQPPALRKETIVQRKASRIIPHPYVICQSLSSFNPAHTYTHTHSWDVRDAVNGEMLSAKCQAISHKSQGDK